MAGLSEIFFHVATQPVGAAPSTKVLSSSALSSQGEPALLVAPVRTRALGLFSVPVTLSIHFFLSHLYALHGFWGPPGLRFSMLLLSHGSWFGSCCPEWRRDPGREPPGFAGCSRFAIRGPQVLSLSPHHDSRAPLLSAWPARLARLAVHTTSVVSSERGSFIGHNQWL